MAARTDVTCSEPKHPKGVFTVRRPKLKNRSASILAGRIGLALSVCVAAPAWAAESSWGWHTVTIENNNLGSNRDRYYVNGFNVAYLSTPVESGSSWAARATDDIERSLRWLFTVSAHPDTRFEWTVLGQQIFTPANKSAVIPDPRDRPYAGWLYTGGSLLRDTDGQELDDLEVTLGVVGPAALGRQVQNSFHKIFGYGSANGWSYQLRNEPAVTLGYSRKWRFETALAADGALSADVIPELGATLGNVHTYGEATTLVRLGRGLAASYGPRILQPGATGGAYFNPERIPGEWGLFAFAGWQGRAIGHDIFLDGNTYQDGPSVSKYPWVHDVFAGVSAYGWGRVRVDLTYLHRSKEFSAQESAEAYGSATVSIRW